MTRPFCAYETGFELQNETEPGMNDRYQLLGLARAYHHGARSADALEALVGAYPERENVLRESWANGGWQAANAEWR